MIKIDKSKEAINIPESIPIIPVRNTVFFPHQFIPLAIGRQKSIKLVDDAIKGSNVIGVIAQRDGALDDPNPVDMYKIGTIARILKVIDFPAGGKRSFIQGITRFETTNYIQTNPYFIATRDIKEDIFPKDPLRIEAFSTNLKNLFQQASELAPEITNEHQAMIANIQDTGIVADVVIAFSNIPVQEKQEILEIFEVEVRLKR